MNASSLVYNVRKCQIQLQNGELFEAEKLEPVDGSGDLVVQISGYRSNIVLSFKAIEKNGETLLF